MGTYMISCMVEHIIIEDIVILSQTTRRKNLTITGTCNVSFDEWGAQDIPMSFSYTGKVNESSSKFYEYLKVKGYYLWVEKTRKEEEKLGDLMQKYGR